MPHKDPEVRREYMRQYKAAHRERIRELDKASYERHREEIAQRRAVARDANREAFRERNRIYGARYRERHRDRIAERRVQRQAENPERVRAYQRAYRVRHADRVRERKRRWYWMHRDEEILRHRAQRDRLRGGPPRRVLTPEERKQHARESAKRYRLRHPEKSYEIARSWRQRNPAYQRDWGDRNRDRRRVLARQWHLTNRERRREQSRARYLADPARHVQWTRAYQARKQGAAVGLVDYAAIIERDKGICGICRRPVARKDRSFDHIVPLKHGGAHSQDNIQLSHRLCNSRRGAGRLPAQMRFLP